MLKGMLEYATGMLRECRRVIVYTLYIHLYRMFIFCDTFVFLKDRDRLILYSWSSGKQVCICTYIVGIITCVKRRGDP